MLCECVNVLHSTCYGTIKPGVTSQSALYKNYQTDFRNTLHIYNHIASTNQISQYYINIITKKGYRSLINKHTRVSSHSKTCIDHIFLRANKKIASTPLCI